MAYIPSHQTLRNHPKLKRLARRLDIAEVVAIGHLHLFWWWGLDYASGGSLAGKDALDIALGSGWERDETTFLDALIECGFIDAVDGGMVIHDWEEYGGKYQDKRDRDADRKRKERADRRTNQDNPPASNGRPTEIRVTARIEEKRREEKKREEVKHTTPPKPPKGEPVEFVDFYTEYPRHTARQDALRAWNKLNPSPELVQEIMTGMRKLLPDYHAREPDKVPHPSTFLNGGRWRDEPVKKQGSVLDGTKPAFVNGRQNYTEDEGKEYLRRHGWITEQ